MPLNAIENLLQRINEPVFAIDYQGRLLYFNAPFDNLTGKKIVKNPDLSLQEILIPVSTADWERLLISPKNSSTEEKSSFKLHNPDGSITLITVERISGISDGLILGIICSTESQAASGPTAGKVESDVFQIIYNLGFEGYILHDKGIIIDANPGFERMMGFSREEVLGKNIIEICVLPEFHSLIYKAMESETAAPYEVKSRKKDGSIIHSEVESRDIYFRGRKIRITVIRDITSRKAIESALKESEERYRKLSDITLEGIFLHDKGIIKDANESLARLVGYELSEIIGKNIIQLVVLPEYHDRVKQALATESTMPYEVKVKRKDGSLLFVEVEARMVNYNNEWLRVTSARDIHWRKEAEKKLRENQEALDSFFNRSEDGFFIMQMEQPLLWNVNDRENCLQTISSAMKLTKVNHAMKKQLGLAEEDVPERSLAELFQWNPFTQSIFTRLFDEGNISFETTEFHRGSDTTWIEGNYTVLYDDEGKIRGCCGVRRNISDRKKSDESIRIHNEELRKTNQELDNFVYRVSHDLKAPISSVKGLINVARLETKPENILECFSLIETSMNKLDSFIMDILDYSRNTRMALEPEHIIFDELIDEIVSNTKFIKEVGKVSIIKSISDDTALYSDKRRLIFIFNNIISNAIRFSDDLKAESFLKITIQSNESLATLQFEDNGIGIHPHHQSRIFEMFYRASESRAGSGLGLYIVKEAVEKLSGTITVKSRPGIGTTFKIVIPNLIRHHLF